MTRLGRYLSTIRGTQEQRLRTANYLPTQLHATLYLCERPQGTAATCVPRPFIIIVVVGEAAVPVTVVIVPAGRGVVG